MSKSVPLQATRGKTGKLLGEKLASYSGKNWPTPRDVVDFREQLKITPPGGAEFGQTEVFYLSVLDCDRTRAALLVDAVCKELEARIQEIRNDRANSMIAELALGVERAEGQLRNTVAKLSKFEALIGSDLGELRYLVSPIGGQSELAQQVLAIEAERRTIEAKRRQNEKLRQILLAAQNDPRQLVTTPSALLASQPALERLKAGLIDSQLVTANLLGSRSTAHPLVAAAQDTQAQIKSQIHRELPLAISGVELASLRKLHHHNTFLGLLTETGLIGLTSFCAMLIGWGRCAWRVARAKDVPVGQRQLGVLLLATLAIYLCSAVFHDLTHLPNEQVILFFIAGLTVAAACGQAVAAAPAWGRAKLDSIVSPTPAPVTIG